MNDLYEWLPDRTNEDVQAHLMDVLVQENMGHLIEGSILADIQYLASGSLASENEMEPESGEKIEGSDDVGGFESEEVLSAGSDGDANIDVEGADSDEDADSDGSFRGRDRCWSREEDTRLRRAIAEASSWEDVAALMPGRTAAACERRCSNVLKIAPFASVKWSVEEEDRLRDAVAGSSTWEEVAALMAGRTAIACKTRCSSVLKISLCRDVGEPSRRKGQQSHEVGTLGYAASFEHGFSVGEDEELRKLMKAGLTWTGVAARIPGRSAEACAKRWAVLTIEGEETGEWDEAKTAALKAAVAELGKRWKKVGRRLGLRPVVCERRWEMLAKEDV
jgi:hypothetical protein